MSVSFELKAETRRDVGKGASRRLRRLENKVPAIVYGAEKEPTMLTLNHHEVSKALQNEAFYSHILNLHIDGKAEKVVLKALQRHPYKPRIQHMDFLRVSAKHKLRMTVPLHFIGGDVAPGVATDGGVISHFISDIEVSCLPADLPEFIQVDISNFGLGDVLHLSGLKMPKGVELPHMPEAGSPQDHPVVSVHVPKLVVEEVIPTEAPTAAPVPTIAGTEEAEAAAAETAKDSKK